MITNFLCRLSIVLVLSAAWLKAAPLETAAVTAAFNKVVIARPDSSIHPANVGDVLTGHSTLETGVSSRAELTFNDQTLARIGANSVFSFDRGTRDLELNQGVIFLQVPKNAGGATIQTAAVTAAITGTTIAIEYAPIRSGFAGAIKIFVLEGTLRAYLRSKPGESLLLQAGEMIAMKPNASVLPDARVFDLRRLVITSGLLGKQFTSLPSMPIIRHQMELQDAKKEKGTLILANYALQGQLPGSMENFQQENKNLLLNSLARPVRVSTPVHSSKRIMPSVPQATPRPRVRPTPKTNSNPFFVP